MRMTRDERERKFRNVWESCDLERTESFMRELMGDLNSADSDLAHAQKSADEAYQRGVQSMTPTPTPNEAVDHE